MHGYAILGGGFVRTNVGFGAYSGGNVCSDETLLSSATMAEGDVIGINRLYLARTAEVRGKCVTDRPGIFGPGSMTAICTRGHVTHPNPTPPRPSEVEDCEAARLRLQTRKNFFLQPTPGLQGPILVDAGTSTTVDVRGKGALVRVDSPILTLKRDAMLVIQGDSDTRAVVVRIASDLRLRANARILTSGISAGPMGSPAERILLLVGGKARLSRNSKIAGTLVATGDVTIGSFARIDGAVFAENRLLRLQRGAIVLHAPWVLW